MSTTSKSIVAIAFLAGAGQMALAIYRAQLLATEPWFGITGGVLLVGVLLGRIFADRSRFLHVAIATIGSVLVFLGVWAIIVSILGGPVVSLIERATVCVTLLSLGVLMVVSDNHPRRRAAAILAFVVGFTALQVAVTCDARWEADQRTKGGLRIWR